MSPRGDGFKAAQFNERQVNMDVHEMRAAMIEMQVKMNEIIVNLNG